MQLIVKTLTGKTISLQVEPTDTIDVIKSKIQSLEGIPVDEQILFLGETPLESGVPLAQYGLVNTNLNDCREIALVTHMRGGNLLHSQARVLSTIASGSQSNVVPQTALSAALSETLAPIRTAKKTRCNMTGCTDKIIKIVGECRYCTRGFCGKHRLPESHECSNLHTVRQASHDRLVGRLIGEKCVASKV